MRWMRGIANAVLMVTLVKPVVRRMVARWRRQARESAAATIGVPMQELFEIALVEELAPPGPDLESDLLEDSEELTGRSTLRTMLVVVALAATIAVATAAVATLIRRRREARAARTEQSEWVAMPVGTATEQVDDRVVEEALVE